jgi:5-methylcytosine-specific restriction endonuclease McrA
MAKFRGVILECKECKKEFRVSPSRIFTAHYCSTECADIHRNDDRKMDKLKRVCPYCGKSFKIYQCHSDRRKYCSYECKDKAAAYSVPIDNHFYTRTFWRKLRKFVLERDGYTCQKCQAKDKILHVHHKKRRFVGGSDTEDNLISLCNSCHKTIEFINI